MVLLLMLLLLLFLLKSKNLWVKLSEALLYCPLCYQSFGDGYI